jgi:hypothetical protein
MGIDHTLDVAASRFIFVHYHIFKNGGTTIESIMRREFGGGFATVHGPGAGSVLDAKGLTKFLRMHPGISAVSSHHLRYPKPDVRGWVIFDCCFLRHPLERLVSLYNHFRREDSADPLCLCARRESPREFMKQLLDDSPNLVSDVQVTQLANAGAFARPARDPDLERATQVFCDMAVPGVVELFDESLVAAEYFLKPAFPGLRLHHRPENVSQPVLHRRQDNRRHTEETLVDLWGGDVYSDLLRLNQLDLELFRRAKIEILRRLFLVPAMDERLAEFKARSAPHRMQILANATEREPVPAKVAAGGAK